MVWQAHHCFTNNLESLFETQGQFLKKMEEAGFQVTSYEK